MPSAERLLHHGQDVFGPGLAPMILRSVHGGTLLRVGRPFVEALGLDADELARAPLLEWLHPDDRDAFVAAVETGAEAVGARHRGRDGDWFAFRWRLRSGPEGLVALGELAEPDARPESLGAQQHPGSAESLSETLAAMVHVVERKNPGLRCSILLVDAARERVTVGAGPSLPAEYNAAVEGLRIGPSVGSCGTAAYWNVPVVVEDIARDPLWQDLREAAALAGVAACWSHPVQSRNGEVLGAMALYASVPGAPTSSQMDGLEIAARMVGLAVERDRLEDQLRQAAKMEALGVLAGGIAHDFNNLQAAVLGNAELARRRLPDDSPARPMLEEIAAASTAANELCNQLLAYAGRGVVAVEPVDCNDLIRELAGLFHVALSKKAHLDYQLGEGPLGVVADRGQLRQVFMNLITNAAEAVGDRRGSIVVATDARRYCGEELERLDPGARPEPGDYVRVVVRDDGCGMDADTRARLFDPFFTTKAQGRGLGMAAVQGIVRGHRGLITVESEPGRGSTFTVLLPRAELRRGAEVVEAAPPVEAAGRRVLVVDDEPRVLAVLGKILEAEGYDVTCAGDGESAIDTFRAAGGAFDCVLLDLSMPKLDGEEVFRELRRIRPDVRVVLSSGFTEREILDRFRGAGLAGVVQKPTRSAVLLRRIAEALAKSPAE